MPSESGGDIVEVPEPVAIAAVAECLVSAERLVRRVVFVVGSGRSGTSTVSGALQTLGLHVPQPQIIGNKANPKGFGEPRWVVDLHKRLLGRANVQTSDARPSAWSDADQFSSNEALQERVHLWLARQFEEGGDELVIKDPRMAWFANLWSAAALRSGAARAYVTMLRPVTEVVGSKAMHYKARLGEVHATAAWVNMMLHTECSTRGSTRAFVRYHDLLVDWTAPLFRLGELFDLSAVKSATDDDIRKVHDFIDPNLRRAQLTWDDVRVPPRLREIAEDSWWALDKLAEPEGDVPETHAYLDEVRAAYTALYEESEAITQSTIVAASRERRPPK